MTLRDDRLTALEARLGHAFRDRRLLDRALTHTSFANEDPEGHTPHSETLEFLGDSILGFLISDRLHSRDPEGTEGEKSRARAALVSEASLAERAEALGLPALLRLGRGEEKTGGRSKAALWADAFEAVLAAVYLDGGIDAARAMVERTVSAEALRQSALATDFKSALQERLQGSGRSLPEYRVLSEEGPPHDRTFRVACIVDGEVLAEAEGSSKKEAQQRAARAALGSLKRT